MNVERREETEKGESMNKVRRWQCMQNVQQVVRSQGETYETTVVVHISDGKSMKANGVS